MKSLKKNELGLLIGLFLIGSLIILYENGFIRTYPPTLIAQEQNSRLTLTKGVTKVIIPKGDWIYTIDKTDSLKTYGGKYIALSDSLILLKNKKGTVRVIPANIKTLYHGEKKRIGHYVGKGIFWGGIPAISWGIFAAIVGGESEGYGEMFVFGTACVGITTFPIGGILGLATGVSKNNHAIEYPLTGPEAWILSIN